MPIGDYLTMTSDSGEISYGRARNAYCFGSRLSVEETRKLAPYRNAAARQVTSPVLAGSVWAAENASAGAERR